MSLTLINSIPQLRSNSKVIDLTDNQNIEVEITDEKRQWLVLLEYGIEATNYLKAAIIFKLYTDRLYLCIEGVNSFSDYIDLRNNVTGWSRSYVFDSIKLFNRIGTFVPDLEVVRHSEKSSISSLMTDNLSSLRIPVCFSPCPPEKQTSWEIIKKTHITKLIALASVDDIDLEPIRYGAAITLPNGELLDSRKINDIRRDDLSRKLTPPPEKIVNSLGTRTAYKEPTDLEVAEGKLNDIARYRREIQSILTSLSLNENSYRILEKSLREHKFEFENLARDFDRDRLISKVVEEFITAEPLSVSELANITGLTERRVRSLASELPSSFVTYEASAGRSGVRYMIRPEGLNKELRDKIRKSVQGGEKTIDEIESDMDVWNKATKAQRKNVEPYFHLIQNTKGLKGRELEQQIELFNTSRPGKKPISLKSFYRKLNDYKQGGLAALIPGWGKSAGVTKVNDKDFKLFSSLYLTQNRISKQECHFQVLGAANTAGRIKVIKAKEYEINPDTGEVLGPFPSAETFYRQLNKRFDNAAIHFARYGEHKLRQTGLSYTIDRDLSHINAGDVWISDHRQIDVLANSSSKVIHDLTKKVLHARISEIDRRLLTTRLRRALAAGLTGKPVRLWVTAWIDFKTGKWLSWFIHEADPNSDHIIQSFKWAVQEHGLPKGIYLDNGKDYRCKDFAGNPRSHKVKIDETHASTLLGQLGVKVTFAQVKNARAKIIERHFRHFIEKFEKHFTTYTGKNAPDRPETTHENIKKGLIPDAIEIIDQFDEFIPVLNQQPREGKELAGRSPDYVWDQEFTEKRAISAQALAMFTMRSSAVRQLKANGYKCPELGYYYYAPWMATMSGRKVYIRRDPQQYELSLVFDAESHALLGEAPLISGTPGWVMDDEDQAKVEGSIAIQRQRNQIIKSQLKEVRKIAVGDALDNYASAVAVKNEIQNVVHGVQDGSIPVSRMTRTGLDAIVTKMDSSNGRGTADMSALVTPKNGKRASDSIYSLRADKPTE